MRGKESCWVVRLEHTKRIKEASPLGSPLGSRPNTLAIAQGKILKIETFLFKSFSCLNDIVVNESLAQSILTSPTQSPAKGRKPSKIF